MSNTIPDISTAEQTSASQPNEESKVSTVLNSLSPINDADKDGHYSSMLLWALQNRKDKDIKNIALTGPYGSGKSSILKTFEKNYESDDLVFLNISLATFKEENGITASKIKPKKNGKSKDDENSDEDESTKVENSSPAEKQALLRLVELSILQQIFYHEKDEDIPDTRFKKTRSFSEESAKELTKNIFLFLISMVYLIYSETIWKMFDVEIPQSGKNLLYVLAFGTVGWMSYHFIRQSIRPLRSVQLKKFNVQQAEFAVDENISKSILNEHLDEILYFFEVTDYTVVVFEDLDRFEQTEIFTKLRELNHLINYSKKMNGRKVAFIYAVRDDMFRDKDRTKFFDFIVPVIPVVDISNSYERLLKIVQKNGYKISNFLLEDISYFVDDMRLLYNIMNEFELYQKKHSKKDELRQNKMLAMVVYKNIYPNDFVKLSCKEGELYSVLAKRGEYVKALEEKIDDKITLIDEKIARIKDDKLPTLKKLRESYIFEILRDIGDFQTFVVDGTEVSVGSLIDDANFKALRESKVAYYPVSPASGYGANHYRRPNSPTTISNFAEIEKRIHPTQTYIRNEVLIESRTNGELKKLNDERAKLEKEKSVAKHKTLKQLLSENKIESDVKDEKQRRLISTLVRAGYIDENYSDFISIFYPGSITPSDREFLMNVRSGQYTAFDYELEKIENLILKLRENEFEQPYILNFSLFDFAFSKRGTSALRSKLIKALTDETDRTVEFIDAFIAPGEHLQTFVPLLAKHWTSIWNYIEVSSNISEERKQTYLYLLIEFADIEDLKKIGAGSDLAAYISKSDNFLNISHNQEKLIKIIEMFKIKFENLSIEGVPDKLFDYVYTNNHYQINSVMLRRMITRKGEYSGEEFETQNYTLFNRQTPTLQKMISYVDSNLETYLRCVWLELPGSSQEDHEYFSYVLERCENDDIRRSCLRKSLTKFPDIAVFDSLDIKQLVIEENSIEPIWTNLLEYYKVNENLFDVYLIDFLNNSANAEALGNDSYEAGENEEDEQFTRKFTMDLLLCEQLSVESFSKIIVSIPWRFSNLDFSGLERAKVEILVPHIGVSSDNYDRLRTSYRPLNIRLIEQNPKSVIDNLAKFTFDVYDLVQVMNSQKIPAKFKDLMLHTVSTDEIVSSNSLLLAAGSAAASNPEIKFDVDTLTAILKSELSVSNKVPLYNRYYNYYDEEMFFELLQYFGDDFDRIKRNSKKPVIPKTEDNWAFAKLIHALGYTNKPNEDKKGIRINNKG